MAKWGKYDNTSITTTQTNISLVIPCYGNAIFATVITQDTIQQIIARMDIVEVVGEFVKLKKRGSNYIGNCPFHNEKSPSFSVSPSREIYKCFGCGKSGNAIGFVMEHEKLNYAESLRWLANKYGIQIEETETSPEFKVHQQTAESLFIINKFAQGYFSQQLLENEDGRAVALSYLEHRGFTTDIIRKFQLGYSPDASDAFFNTALKQQFNKENLKLSGLVNEREGRWFDNYRNRIIFPVHNNTGKVIGFGARLIKANDKAPKYINTPENELYIKSKLLYGLFFARQEIDKKDECLLVEGYTDVISLHQAGVENVVASGGTSLTTDQLRLVRKYTNNLTIIYDGDNAGIKAALRGLDMALEEGLNVHLVLIPDKEDPDSYVRKIGKEAFNEFIKNNKKDFILFQLETALKDAGNDSQKKAEIVNRIAESIAKVNKAEDFTKQQDYVRQSAALLKVDELGLTNLVNKFIRDKVGKFETKAEKDEPKILSPQEQVEAKQYEETLTLLIRNELQERSVLRCLLLYGQNKMDDTQNFSKYIFDTLSEFHYDNALLEKIAESYRLMNDTGMEPSEKSFVYHEDAEVRGMVMSLLEFPYELSMNWDKKLDGMHITDRDTSMQDVLQSVNYFKLRKIKQMIEENQGEMEKAAMEEQMQMMRIHAELKKIEREITTTLGTVIFR